MSEIAITSSIGGVALKPSWEEHRPKNRPQNDPPDVSVCMPSRVRHLIVRKSGGPAMVRFSSAALEQWREIERCGKTVQISAWENDCSGDPDLPEIIVTAVSPVDVEADNRADETIARIVAGRPDLAKGLGVALEADRPQGSRPRGLDDKKRRELESVKKRVAKMTSGRPSPH